ncbi:hypothetical protein [Lujinxingia sediminis]|uniref:hypothetical protein n=1 Tax=Lujinxingia sediminis TaxID=2480984 RepID=UPI0013E2E9D8|nr:hypothetical protein [Lujinxingia sediminis]
MSDEHPVDSSDSPLPRPGAFQVDEATRRRNRLTAIIITMLVLTMILVGTRHQLFGP